MTRDIILRNYFGIVSRERVRQMGWISTIVKTSLSLLSVERPFLLESFVVIFSRPTLSKEAKIPTPSLRQKLKPKPKTTFSRN